MSYTITDDGGTIAIRATLVSRVELKELIGKLQERLDAEKESNISTNPAPDGAKAGEA